jgi:hypothetical protein
MAEALVELDTIAELSLALIGFSALIAMFRGGSIRTWQPRPRLAFWTDRRSKGVIHVR